MAGELIPPNALSDADMATDAGVPDAPEVELPRRPGNRKGKPPKLANKKGRQGDGGGRPRIKLDLAVLSALVECGCTIPEIAEVMKCSEDTISDNYQEEMKSARNSRNAKLRRKQFQLAMEGNTGMLVWLGKQWLGQTDRMPGDADNPFATQGGNAGMPVIEVVFVTAEDGHLVENPAQPQIATASVTNTGD